MPAQKHPAHDRETKKVGCCICMVVLVAIIMIIVAIYANQSRALTQADKLVRFNYASSGQGELSGVLTMKALCYWLAWAAGLVLIAAIVGAIAVFGCVSGMGRKSALSCFSISMVVFGIFFLFSAQKFFVRHEVVAPIIKNQMQDFCNKTTYARLVSNLGCPTDAVAARRLNDPLVARSPDLEPLHEEIVLLGGAKTEAERRLWTADCGTECQTRVDMLKTMDGCKLLTGETGICGRYVYEEYGGGYPTDASGVQLPMWTTTSAATDGDLCKKACNWNIQCPGYITVANGCRVISPVQVTYSSGVNSAWTKTEGSSANTATFIDPPRVEPADGVTTFQKKYSMAFSRFNDFSWWMSLICLFFSIFLFCAAIFACCHLFTSSMVRKGKPRGGQLCCLMLCPCAHDSDDEDRLKDTEHLEGYSSDDSRG